MRRLIKVAVSAIHRTGMTHDTPEGGAIATAAVSVAAPASPGSETESTRIEILERPSHTAPASSDGNTVLLEIQGLTMQTPDGATQLVQNLNLQVKTATSAPICRHL
jgi:hypothetical protein